MKIAVIVPTLNAGTFWNDWIEAFKSQSQKVHSVLIIDSGSEDNTVILSRQSNFEVHEINKSDFNHGGTRQLALNMLDDIDIVVYLTQDAILANEHSLSELLDIFSDNTVGAAFGRQLPRKQAKPIEAHARLFNYSATSALKDHNEIAKQGFKLIFFSNSFAAYRVSALRQIGGFPDNVILGEDTYVCAKLILANWKVAYQSQACVYHSHDYSITEEFRRYFDTGAFHNQQRWLIDKFGEPGGYGLKFVKSELSYLLRNSPQYIPEAILRTISKYIAYKLGRHEKNIPDKLKFRLSMNRQYWQT